MCKRLSVDFDCNLLVWSAPANSQSQISMIISVPFQAVKALFIFYALRIEFDVALQHSIAPIAIAEHEVKVNDIFEQINMEVMIYLIINGFLMSIFLYNQIPKNIFACMHSWFKDAW